MNWIAPSEEDTHNAALEKRLWDAAEQAVPAPHFAETDFNGGGPLGLLGLIFLRFAEGRFTAQRAKLEKASASTRSKCEVRSPSCEVHLVRHSSFDIRHWPRLPAEARFDYLLNLPEAENIGAKVNAAMRDVAKCEVRVANSEVQSLRHSKFVIRHSPIPASLDYDAFGRIYEYFLGEFAMSEGQGGGEPSGASSTTGTVARRVSASDSANQFYTPSSIVRLLTEVIEPYHGRN